MTNHNDAIDRALANAHGKLDNQNPRQCAEDFDRERRRILTDLAAEIEDRRMEAVAMSEQLDQERKDLEARLAAVVEARKQLEHDKEHRLYPWALFVKRVDAALARGEGGEQAEGFGKGAEKPSQEGEPAAPPATPDDPQITMHAYAPPLSPDLRRIYGGPCSHCGREPEHSCHGNASRDDVTKPQQLPALHMQVLMLQAKLAAVRAWADDQAQEYHADLERLDAILDGKEAEDR